ncbi:beta-galactosidase small subunit [Clostridium sp. AM34-9AC]|jgi:beta-galactosidase|uniref:beta-galactosidase small subunit n=1 Tax=Clostridium sp. AM34-9AC TaxID=2293030 RepID=UPI000E4E2D0A|nr:beta-galactosidase small subunit [Clostridium sp. AM34-9AC]RHT16555.1 beta-galactosidase small subunit [Clostridium sp. AM34-9AC]
MAFRIVIGDVTIGIQGQDFAYIFSVGMGGMESLYKDGKEWLYRAPRPAFWRAATDNDRGNGFVFRSAVWSAADRFVRCVKVTARMDEQEISMPPAPENNKYNGDETCDRFEISYTYETPTVPVTEVTVSYLVESDGRIHVQVDYLGKQGLPELPVLGLRFLMPTAAEGYTYEGLSGETYPDRMAGGIPGVYEVQGLPVTPYMVPQDCGMHMQTKWLEIVRKTSLDNTDRGERSSRLKITAEEGKHFAFSCLPYTAQELENAMHHEELPPARRTVLSVLGAVRGVGGIDSWGADVEAPYHISGEQNISYGFWIE